MMRFNTKSYKALQKSRTAFYTAIAVLFAVFVMPSAVLAQSYTVEGIDVDVSAANAVEAREKAFEEAQVKGYKMLAERFLSEKELTTFEAPDINTVSAFVKDYEVTKEKLSATRYAGVYKIRYSSKAFSKQGTGNNAEGTAQTGQSRSGRGKILIFPFFEEAGYPSLWRSNPFMAAWVRARDNKMSAPAIVPLGDTQDISAIRDNQALKYNPKNLEILKRRYRAEQVAILMATPELMPDGTKNVAVGIYQAKEYGPELSRQISVRSRLGEGTEQFYNRVVDEVNKVFQASWKRQTAVAQNNVKQAPVLTGPVNTIVAQVRFSTMRQWVDTKKSLERSRGVAGINVKSLSPRSATLTMSYQGSVENLRSALRQNGIGLNDPLTQQGQFGQTSSIYRLSPRF